MSGPEPQVVTVGHLTFTEKHAGRILAECHHPGCGLGVEAPPSLGPIPQDVMLAEWVKQHTHTTKKKRTR